MSDFIYTFIPIFVAMDIPGLAPIFVSLTKGLTPAQERTVTVQALFTAFAVSVAFIAVGKFVFQVIGITPSDFQIAGGILLLMIGMREVFLGGTIERVPDPNVGPVPLGIPLMVGPAVLTSLMIMIPLRGYTVTLAALFANLLLAGLAFSGSRWITRVFNPHVLRAVSQLIGLLLAAIAVSMIRRGLQHP